MTTSGNQGSPKKTEPESRSLEVDFFENIVKNFFQGPSTTLTNSEIKNLKAEKIQDIQICNFTHSIKAGIVEMTEKKWNENNEVISNVGIDLKKAKLPEEFKNKFYEKMRSDGFKVEEREEKDGKKCVISWYN